ncbi:MAG: EamA family transporter, partial [Pedobacter sp.]
YLAALFGLESMKPFVLSSLRYLTAGILLTAWILLRKLKWPQRKDITVLSVSGVLMLVGGSGLVVFAEQYISSGYAAVIVATEPLWFVLLDRKRWGIYFRNLNICLGLLIGFTGIALFSWFSPNAESADNTDKLIGTFLTLLSAMFWVTGTLYAGKVSKASNSTVVNTTVQIYAAGIFCVLLALVLGEWDVFRVEDVTPKAWGGLLFMVVMGSIMAYMAFNWLVTVQPPAIVSTHTYVNPVVAIFAGWLLANERITLYQGISLAIVLAGVILAQTGKIKVVPDDVL